METIEEVVESEAGKYNLGNTQCASLLGRLVIRGRELGISYDAIISNLIRIGRITRFCINPYESLRLTVEAYERETDRTMAQGIIGSLAMTYESRKNLGDKDRFTIEEIEVSIYVLANCHLIIN